MAGSSSDAGGMDVASEHVAEDGEDDTTHIMMNIISFNFGMQQVMLESRAWQRKYAQKFAQLLDTFSQDYIADVVLGCKVGGHKQGMNEEQHRSHLHVHAELHDRTQSERRHNKASA